MDLFLKQREVSGDSLYNFLSQRDKRKYLIDTTDLPKFWELYNQSSGLSISVRPRKFGMARLDIDVKLPKDYSSERLISPKDITDTIDIFNIVLSRHIPKLKPENLTAVVYTKPQTKGSDFIKEGVHIEYPFCLIKKEDFKLVILPAFLKEASGLFTRYNSKDIFDIHASGSNPWLLYGSIKEDGKLPYQISSVIDSELNEVEFKFGNETVSTETQFEFGTTFNPQILDISNETQKLKFLFETNQVVDIPSFQLPQLKKWTEEMNNCPEDRLKTIRELLLFLSPDRASSYQSWYAVGNAIANETGKSLDGLELFLEFSARASNFDKVSCIALYQKNKGKATLGTIRHYAKIDDADRYQKYYAGKMSKSLIGSIKRNGQLTNVACAEALHAKYNKDYVYDKGEFYQFVDHHWKRESKESTELYHKISELKVHILEELKKLREQIAKLMEEEDEDSEDEEESKQNKKQQKELEKERLVLLKEKNKLEDTPFRKKIIQECMVYFKDSEFVEKLNQNPKLLGFENGVYDLTTNSFRDGQPEDYITFRMGVPFTSVSIPTTKAKVMKYFGEVFQEEELKRYVLTYLGTLLEGYNTHKGLHYFTGSGNNSKSVLIGILSKLFGDYAGTLPTSVFSGKRTQSSACSPELVMAVLKRFVVCQEASKREEFNEGLMKELSGNDEIYIRGLYKDGKKIRPQFKLIFPQNNIPNLINSDKAVWKRIRIIPFNTEFTLNPTKENQIQIDESFSFDTEMIQELLLILIENHKTYQNYVPEIVLQATQKAKMMNDSILLFTKSCLNNDGISKVSLAETFDEYKMWFEKEHQKKCDVKKLEFIEKIKECLEVEKNYIKGYSLLNSDEQSELIELEVEDQDYVKLRSELSKVNPSDSFIRQKKVLELFGFHPDLNSKITKYIKKNPAVVSGIKIEFDSSHGNKWYIK